MFVGGGRRGDSGFNDCCLHRVVANPSHTSLRLRRGTVNLHYVLCCGGNTSRNFSVNCDGRL
jgi:hypothetical protein